MSQSLRDQLLGLGYKAAAKPERPLPRPETPRRPQQASKAQSGTTPAATPAASPAAPPAAAPRRPAGRPHPAKPARSQQEIDLGKAYALRAQKEKDERIAAEQLKQEQARQRREAKAQVTELFKDKSLNDPAAEIARHFEYGGKIKRIHVTPEQLTALNAGELGVAQLDGRYLLLPVELVRQAQQVFAPAVALLVDPDAAKGDDPYSDPAYRVPDDLVW